MFDEQIAGEFRGEQRLFPAAVEPAPAGRGGDEPAARADEFFQRRDILGGQPVRVHADGAEAGGGFQRLLDLRRRRVEKNQIAVILNDQRLAVLGEGEINGAAGEGDLRAGRLENLVGGHDNTAVGLDAHLELVPVVGRDSKTQSGEQEGKNRSSTGQGAGRHGGVGPFGERGASAP